MFDSDEETDLRRKKSKSSFQVSKRTTSSTPKSLYGSHSQSMATRVTTPVGTHCVITVIIMSSRFHITSRFVCAY